MQLSQDIEKYYLVLGVNRATPLSQIREAHKRLISEWHPDRFDFNDPRRATAELRAKEINEAFQQVKLLRTSGLGYTKVKPRKARTQHRRRTERLTVESKIEFRNGKVVKIKRKRKSAGTRLPLPQAASDELPSSSRRKSGMKEMFTTAKALKQALGKTAAVEVAKQPSPEDLVVHIVEGKKSVRAA